MVDVKFNKRVLADKLHPELEQAGYAIYGVTCYADPKAKKYETIVHLKPEETKDPSSLVMAHVPWRVEADKDSIQADGVDDVEFVIADLEAGADRTVNVEIYRAGETTPTATDTITLEYDADYDALTATYSFSTELIGTWVFKFTHRGETITLEVDAVA